MQAHPDDGLRHRCICGRICGAKVRAYPQAAQHQAARQFIHSRVAEVLRRRHGAGRKGGRAPAARAGWGMGRRAGEAGDKRQG